MFRNKRLLLAMLLVLAVGAIASAYIGQPGKLSVTFLDVGEGLSVVMRTPSGKTIVYDCGTSGWRDPSLVGERVTARYLRSIGVNRIDLAILSHPHEDHCSGYAGLVRKIPATNIMDIGATSESPSFAAFIRQAKRCRSRIRTASAGDKVILKDGVRLMVLNPVGGSAYLGTNEASMIVKVSYKDVSFLLTADATSESESSVVGRSANVRAQVLQVGHHGSAGATSELWLAKVRPRVAIVSCGRSNRFNHPSPETLERLEDAGVKVYRTDTDGAVSFTTDGRNLHVRTHRKR